MANKRGTKDSLSETRKEMAVTLLAHAKETDDKKLYVKPDFFSTYAAEYPKSSAQIMFDNARKAVFLEAGATIAAEKIFLRRNVVERDAKKSFTIASIENLECDTEEKRIAGTILFKSSIIGAKDELEFIRQHAGEDAKYITELCRTYDHFLVRNWSVPVITKQELDIIDPSHISLQKGWVGEIKDLIIGPNQAANREFVANVADAHYCVKPSVIMQFFNISESLLKLDQTPHAGTKR